MITDLAFYLAAIPAVFLVGLSKGGFGGSIALIGVPLMALAISPVEAAGILLPILVAMDIVGLVAWRGRGDAGVVGSMLPFSVLGVDGRLLHRGDGLGGRRQADRRTARRLVRA